MGEAESREDHFLGKKLTWKRELSERANVRRSVEARVRRKAWRAERMQLVGCTEGGTQEPHGTRDSMERCERCVNGAKPKRKGNGNSGGPRYSCERYTRTCRSHYYHVPKQRAPPEGPLPLFGTTVFAARRRFSRLQKKTRVGASEFF